LLAKIIPVDGWYIQTVLWKPLLRHKLKLLRGLQSSESEKVKIQVVRTKGIQNKKLYFGNCHTRIRLMSPERKTLKVYFFMAGLGACASW
jgi:hypothetical protein